MKQCFISFACLLLFFVTSAQELEFPKGLVMYLESLHGAATNFTSAPDLFVGDLRVSPQLTIVPGVLRIGGTAGLLFNNKRLDGLFGPNMVVRLASINKQPLGSVLNVQLQVEHLWGTHQQKLLGGLLHAELGQLLLVGLGIHRDYGDNYWWFQAGVGYNLLHKKKKGLEDPMK